MIALAQAAQRRTLVAKMLAGRKPRRRPMPRQQQPNAIRLSYSRVLLEVVRTMHAVLLADLRPRLERLVHEAALVHDATAPTNYADELHQLIDQAAQRLFSAFPLEKLRRTALDFGVRTSKHQAAELNKQLRAAFGKEVALDVTAERGIGKRLDVFASENAALIRSVPQRYFAEVEALTLRSLRHGQRAEDIEEEIQARTGVSESRARLIARDQIGKLNGQLNSVRQQALGIEKFTWRTCEDERVREEHEELDGQAFPWDAPPSEGIPGEPINCRCTGEPDVDSVIDAL